MVGWKMKATFFLLVFSIILLNFACFSIQLKFVVYCDCDWDGVYDIKKEVWVSGDPAQACPACCRCLGTEFAPFLLDPLPFVLPSPGTTTPSILGPGPTLTTLPGRSVFVPYEDGAMLVDIRIRAKNGLTWILVQDAEIDTGAAITLFPRVVGERIGIDLKSGQVVEMKDVSGTKLLVFIHEVEIQFLAPDGSSLQPIIIRAAFAESNAVPLLIGRLDFISFVQIITEKEGFYLMLR